MIRLIRHDMTSHQHPHQSKLIQPGVVTAVYKVNRQDSPVHHRAWRQLGTSSLTPLLQSPFPRPPSPRPDVGRIDRGICSLQRTPHKSPSPLQYERERTAWHRLRAALIVARRPDGPAAPPVWLRWLQLHSAANEVEPAQKQRSVSEVARLRSDLTTPGCLSPRALAVLQMC